MNDQITTATKTKPIEILVNNSPVSVPGHAETGASIKQAAGLPLDFSLYDPDGAAIGNEESIKVHHNERFIAISGQDVS
jgi:hypothetical protein